MKIDCAHDEVVPVSKLVPNPRNPNGHGAKQLKLLAEIMKYQGVRNPIVVSKRSGFIVKGHGRLEAAKLNEWDRFPVDYQDYDSEAQEYADMIADNKIAELAESDEDLINELAREIKDQLPDIDLIGIPDFQLPEDIDAENERADFVPEVKEATTKLGDLWILGEHRVLCGDSTNAQTVSNLFGDKKHTLYLTDPPYGVSYSAKNVFLNAIAPGKRIEEDILGDTEKTATETGEKVWLPAHTNAINSATKDASYYVFCPQGGDLMMMMMIGRAGWTLKHMLVWAKNNHVLGRCDYHYKHEPIFFGWNERHKFYGSSSCVSLIEYDKPLKNDLHPTMKPVELLRHLIENSSQENEIVYDPFLGSGSTLIACDKLKRKCYGLEMSPQYCDVIVARYEEYTGKKAELIRG